MQGNQNVSVHIETLSLLACHQKALQSHLYQAIESELCDRYSRFMRAWKTAFLSQQTQPFVPFRYERIPLILAALMAQRSRSPILVMDPIFIGMGSFGWQIEAVGERKSLDFAPLVAKYIDYKDREVPKHVTRYASVGVFSKEDQTYLTEMGTGCSVEMALGDQITLKLLLAQDARSESFLTLLRSSGRVTGTLLRLMATGEQQELQKFYLPRLKATAEEVLLEVPPEVSMYLMASDPDTFLQLSIGKNQLVSPVCLPDGVPVPAKLYRLDGETANQYVDISMTLFTQLHEHYPWLWCRDLAGLVTLWQKALLPSTIKRKP